MKLNPVLGDHWLKVLLVATVWLALRQSKQIVVIRGVLPLHR
jgi:uncharacterized membrane protein